MKGDGPVSALDGPGGRQNAFGFFAMSTFLYRSAPSGVNGIVSPWLFTYLARSLVFPPGAPSQRPVRSGGVAAGAGDFACPATELAPTLDASATAHPEATRNRLVFMLVRLSSPSGPRSR